jgi:amino acid transporter
MIGNFAQYIASLVTISESLAAMGEKSILGSSYLYKLSRWNTPFISITINAILIAVASILPFTQILTVDIALYCLGLIGEMLAFLWLKFRRPHLERGYHYPFGKIGATIGTILVVGVCIFTIATTDYHTLIIAAVVVGGSLLIYFPITFINKLSRTKKILQSWSIHNH